MGERMLEPAPEGSSPDGGFTFLTFTLPFDDDPDGLVLFLMVPCAGESITLGKIAQMLGLRRHDEGEPPQIPLDVAYLTLGDSPDGLAALLHLAGTEEEMIIPIPIEPEVGFLLLETGYASLAVGLDGGIPHDMIDFEYYLRLHPEDRIFEGTILLQPAAEHGPDDRQS